MIDMRAERCKTCIHTTVCGRDMNITGAMYVSPNPMFFTKEYCDEALRKYQEREAAGFPCKFYKCMCKDCKHNSLNMVSGNAFCELGVGLSQIYDFCSHGERRDNE